MEAAGPLMLREFNERPFSTAELSYELGELVWRAYGTEPRRINVEFPSPKTGGKWLLKNLGWVGLVPLGPDRTLERSSPRSRSLMSSGCWSTCTAGRLSRSRARDRCPQHAGGL